MLELSWDEDIVDAGEWVRVRQRMTFPYTSDGARECEERRSKLRWGSHTRMVVVRVECDEWIDEVAAVAAAAPQGLCVG